MAKKDEFFQDKITRLAQLFKYQREGWIYRGQPNSKDRLRTTLERAFSSYGLPRKNIKRIEERLLREFQRKYHHYSKHVPRSCNILEWLSLMRHYGAPTRLIDFTYSFYVGTYFALEGAKGDSALWAVNAEWALENSRAKFKKGTDEWTFLKDTVTAENEKLFTNVFMPETDCKQFACPQNPFRLNERLTIQKGVFLCPGDITISFEHNLQSLSDSDKRRNVLKIIIPKKFRMDILKILDGMNISRATLFPGLDGFAQSLNVLPPKGWDKG